MRALNSVDKYFEKDQKRTLEELQAELTDKEIRKIIHSPLDVKILLDSDGKIEFEYMKPPQNPKDFETYRKVRENIMHARKEEGIENSIEVYKVSHIFNGRPIYEIVDLSQVEELSRYTKI